MHLKSALLALGLAVAAAPLSAQIVRRDPSTRRPAQTGTIGDIIFRDSSSARPGAGACRVRDARTPDGRIVQVCDDRRSRNGKDDDNDGALEHRRDGRGRKAHVNDRDGDGDFDARDRALRKAEKDRQKALKKQSKSLRRGDD